MKFEFKNKHRFDWKGYLLISFPEEDSFEMSERNYISVAGEWQLLFPDDGISIYAYPSGNIARQEFVHRHRIPLQFKKFHDQSTNSQENI